MGSEHFRIFNWIQIYYNSISELFSPTRLDHALDKLINLLSTVSSLSTLKKVHKLGLRGESTTGTGKLEGPQEVIGLLEVGSNGPEFVNKVCNGGDSVLSENGLNDGVVRKRDS